LYQRFVQKGHPFLTGFFLSSIHRTAMIKLEIEILSVDAKNYQYELRNYLNERLENMQVSIKEKPAGEGQMSPFTPEGILDGVIHAGLGIGIEQCVHVFLPLLKDFFKHIHIPSGKKVEILATMGDGSERVTISEDNDGVSKRYDNVHYSIDTGHTRAVLIGNSEFDNDFSPISPVKNNIEDFCKLLSDKRNIGLLPENISIALDKTNTEIEELLLRVSKLPDTETLLIYFTGHGYRSDVNKLFLIARNTRKIDDYISGGIDYDFIKNVVLKSSPAKQKIVILDACHSGIATQGASDAMLDLNVTGSYVMASSESDESSYFDKNKRNTFFTASLLDTLTHGLDNDQEMLALNDLYENAKNHLDQRQQPLFKNKLNISPVDFFIARNPAFSFEKSIQHARQLFKDGSLFEALKECRKILKRQPDNSEVNNLAVQCNSDLLLAQFIKQGDEYFYQRHQYSKALENYQQAYEIKSDYMTAEKIKNCREAIQGGGMADKVEPGPKKERATKAPEEHQEESEKKNMPAKLLVLGIAVLVIFGGWWLLSLINKHKEKTDFTTLTAMLDNSPAQALEQLREAEEKDSAYYIIGKYYQGHQKPDSAVYYYSKAITAANLPAANSALAALYFEESMNDSKKMKFVYELLKRADSLSRADTSAYFMLGGIQAKRAYWAINGLSNGDPDALMDEAERWYLKGFKKGSVQCGSSLGFFYLYERKNAGAAFTYLKAAAENNVHLAQFFVSDMLAHGNGIPKNTDESNRWFRIFLETTGPVEMLQTAFYYSVKGGSFYKGYTVEPDCARAAAIYRATENKVGTIPDDHDRSNTYLTLGNYYYNKNAVCREVVTPDHPKAREYYKKASELGNATARAYLEDSTLIR
jgi:TPR repeat protein